ncbi:sensor histidine kinase [Shimia thalassica]|uniref:sensor histidine kinase n=1 Tax=Shimia thalassica TaxID=1715693 RepID=UPI002493EE39|nr:ATP-binding protein [Shimia thalassica]
MSATLAKSFVHGIPMPSVFVGSNKRIIAANEGALTLNPKADETSPFVLVFRQPGLTEALDSCLANGTEQRAIYHHHDGPLNVRYNVTFSRVTGEEVDGVLLCFTDVTHLQQADKMRRDFVANVSHELRTPLTAILGFIETIQGPARGDPEAQQRFLTTMSAEASRMNRLVGDLLSLSRVEEEARMRPTSAIDLDQLLRSVLRNLETVAEENGGQFLYDAPDVATSVTGDPDQLLQVFTNLIENALKYGGQGTQVSIKVSFVARDHVLRKPALLIAISDNGPGIDAVHLPRLTERFYRIDSHRSREMGGTGLGLAIVKHILNRHRGRLQVESTLGQGSTFTVILPKK